MRISDPAPLTFDLKPKRYRGFTAPGWFGLLPFEDKETLRLTLDKLENNLIARSQNIRYQTGGTIADTQPDELGRMSGQNGPLVKIRILGSNRKPMLFGPIPNDPVIGFHEADRLDVR
jgi:hypothetical protein